MVTLAFPKIGTGMNGNESKQLLADDSQSQCLDEIHWPYYARRRDPRQRLVTSVLITLFVSTNVFWLLLFFGTSKSASQAASPQNAYYGSPSTSPMAFNHDWTGLLDSEARGSRYREEEWHAVFPRHGGVVALSKEFAEQHSLGEAAAAPEDPNKMIYMVAGYHQLHCAGVVRDAVYYLNGTLEWPDESGFIWDHVLHCIDAVRQALTCSLDDTLIPLNETWPGIPNGQKHVCRNRDVLRSWVDDHGHPLPIDPRTKSASTHIH